MAESNSVTMTFGYSGTDFTRKYKFDNVSASALLGVKAGIKAVNASLEAGTAGGLSQFFVSDDFNGTIGSFTGITAAQIDSVTESVIAGVGV
jgi:hypothetical protein